GGGAQPVHQSDVVLASRGVAPQYVGLAVTIEVADPLHLPSLVAQRVDRTRPGDRETVHQVDVVLAGRSVAPQDVCLAVAVEVADPVHLPARGRNREEDAVSRSGAHAVHRADVVLAGRRIAPQDVRAAVAVVIAARVEERPRGVIADAAVERGTGTVATLLEVRGESVHGAAGPVDNLEHVEAPRALAGAVAAVDPE